MASVVVGRAVSVGFGAVGRGSRGGLGVAVVGDGVYFHAAFYGSHLGLLRWKTGLCSSLSDDFGFAFAVGGFGFFEDGEELFALDWYLVSVMLVEQGSRREGIWDIRC